MGSHRRLVLLILAGVAAVPTSAACSSNAGAADEPLVVFAAASLTDVMTELAGAYEDDHPGTQIELSFAASSALREQILEGAPAAVFASANTATMDQVEAGGTTSAAPVVFTRNSMQIAVPSGNPAAVTGVTDFARPELLIGLCAEPVPCGRYARAVLREAGVTAAVDTNEPNVRSLLTKLEAGELDAGVVYHTDVASSHAVEAVDIPEQFNVVADYLIAPLTNDPHPAADDFIGYLAAEPGRRILQSHGFLLP